MGNANEALVKEALKWVGVQESGGNNRGPEVQVFQNEVGIKPGAPYCMAFAQYCVNRTSQATGESILIPSSASSLDVWANTPDSQKFSTPAPGLIAIWKNTKTGSGHTAIVTESNSDGTFKTVEGNTVVGEQEGVFAKTRSMSGNGDLELVGFINPYNTTPKAVGGTTTSGKPSSEIKDTYLVGEEVPLFSGSSTELIDMDGAEAQLVIDTNLDNPPWWKEGLVGNPHLKRIPTPVTFKILLSELSPSEYLPNRPAGADPLEIRLNCSLSQISQKMRHVINKSNSRSGYHLTFWGMEPDMISGSGSTGAFMNSFGLTDLMSLEGTVDKLGFGEQVDNAGGDDNALMRKAIQNTDPTKRLRVAAQDAFIELLSLFKNNGVVRFKTKNYSDAFDSRAQLDKSVWSTQYGASTYERKARNNDIMARGGVVMTYKGNTFQGYFKSFNWTMDADNPFQWKFDFTFQVQRTVHLVYYKNATTMPT